MELSTEIQPFQPLSESSYVADGKKIMCAFGEKFHQLFLLYCVVTIFACAAADMVKAVSAAVRHG